MSTNTNTKQTRQIDTSNSSTDDESDHIEIDPSPERTPFGTVYCPHEGCERTVPTERGLPTHYGRYHQDESLIIDLVGRETWIAYLKQEHVEHRRPARDISDSIPDLIKEDTVMADLRRFGLYERFAESNVSAYEILVNEDVTTIEDAQAMSRKLREEGGA